MFYEDGEDSSGRGRRKKGARKGSGKGRDSAENGQRRKGVRRKGVKKGRGLPLNGRKGTGGRKGKRLRGGRGSSVDGRRRNDGWRGKRGGRRGKGYIKDMMETRRRVENYEYMDMSSSESDKPNQGRMKERPPPGLTGKQIGLWYRDRSKRKKLDKEEYNREPCIELTLDRAKERAIRELIDSIGTPLKVPIQTNIPERIIKLKSKVKSKPRSRSRSKSPKDKGIVKKENEVLEDTKPLALNNKYDHMEESAFKKLFLSSITGSMMTNVDNALEMKSKKLDRDEGWDQELLEDLREKQKSPQYQEMQEFRKKLPSWSKQKELLRLIEDNQILVISGETGCGKTTQVAQFILDNEIEKGAGSACHVVCTQPRRISAISVAERVASERNETVGIGGGGVGYTIRLESHAPRDRGSILFCTTGILLRMLEDDPALTRVSHLILDEIHERDVISDFAITILKDIMPKRPDLRLILMSATLNADHFSKYYNNCVMFNIPGFTFPVKEYYLEDVLQMTRYIPRIRNQPDKFRQKANRKVWRMKNKEKQEMLQFRGMVHPFLRELAASGEYSRQVIDHLYNQESEEISLELIAELIKHIDRKQKEGAILVFLPGWDKISTLNKILTQQGYSERNGYLVIPLHSMLSTVSQKTVFNRPPKGVRKIVIATNIAETSITIDDVVYVVDCGKIKMKNFDLNLNITTLQEEWVSLANARQRRGRAGRVQEGVCYHLFTRAREMMLEAYPVPEMMRTRLEEVILQAKMLQLGEIKPFLSKVLNPPDPKAIDLSLKLLYDLNALDSDEHLTPLGYHLARLPMDPQTGKMILMGALFGVADPIFSVAASLSFKDAFVVPIEKETEFFKKKKELAMGTKSDHLVMAEALTRWEAENVTNGGWHFTQEYYLSSSTLALLKDMKKQFAHHLYEMRFLSTDRVKDQECNRNSHNIGLVKAIICAGLYPNIAIIRNVKKNKKTGKVTQKIYTPEDGNVNLHQRSINYDEENFEGRFLVYHLKMKTSKVFLHDTTMVFALALIFFGHNFELFKENGMVVIELSPKIRFTCSASTALLVKELRQRLDQLLEYKVAHPGVTNWDPRSDEGKLLRAIADLISHEDEKLSMADYSDEEDYDDDEDQDFGYEHDRTKRGFSTGQEENDYYQFMEEAESRHQRNRNYDEAGPSYRSSSRVTPFPRF